MTKWGKTANNRTEQSGNFQKLHHFTVMQLYNHEKTTLVPY